MNENDIRKKICAYGKSLFERGLSGGSSGNISARVTDGWLMTPTGISIGALNPAALSKLDEHGKHVSGLKPTKEKFLHLTMYQERPTAGAVVHLHSTYTVAVSCLVNVNPEDVLPPITAYFVMRIGRLPLVPYYRPGDPALGDAIRGLARKHTAVLLANHGPVVAGKTLESAVNAVEELEETAKLYFLLQSHKTRYLTLEQVEEIHRFFPIS